MRKFCKCHSPETGLNAHLHIPCTCFPQSFWRPYLGMVNQGKLFKNPLQCEKCFRKGNVATRLTSWLVIVISLSLSLSFQFIVRSRQLVEWQLLQRRWRRGGTRSSVSHFDLDASGICDNLKLDVLVIFTKWWLKLKFCSFSSDNDDNKGLLLSVCFLSASRLMWSQLVLSSAHCDHISMVPFSID